MVQQRGLALKVTGGCDKDSVRRQADLSVGEMMPWVLERVTWRPRRRAGIRTVAQRSRCLRLWI